MASGYKSAVEYCTVTFLVVLCIHQIGNCCPINDVPECQCKTKFNRIFDLSCSNLSSPQLPQFTKPSSIDIVYKYFTILPGSSVSEIQDNAFSQFYTVNGIKFQGIGISSIKANAFNYLDEYCLELHLDDNKITNLHGKFFKCIAQHYCSYIAVISIFSIL